VHYFVQYLSTSKCPVVICEVFKSCLYYQAHFLLDELLMNILLLNVSNLSIQETSNTSCTAICSKPEHIVVRQKSLCKLEKYLQNLRLNSIISSVVFCTAIVIFLKCSVSIQFRQLIAQF